MDVAKTGKSLNNVMGKFQGDRVVLVIVLLLMGISILAIFGSTSQLAATNSTSRVQIISAHLKTVGFGILAMVICYNIRSVTIYRVASQIGFLLSAAMLVVMYATVDKGGFIHGDYMNESAIRYLVIGGTNLQVFEFVKVFMIFYLSWATSAYLNDKFSLTRRLAAMDARMAWIGTKFAQRVIYFYIPMAVVTLLVLKGGTSSAVIIAGIMYLTLLLGGMPLRNTLLFGVAALVGVVLVVGISLGTGGKFFPRLQTAVARIERSSLDEEDLLKLPKNSVAYEELKDNMLQPVGAKIAIRDARVMGKGFGKSTQKYKVPVMFEDYMFSYIVEETGIWGAMLLIVLYCTLLARGSIIVRGLKNTFARSAVIGTVLLITCQAFLHMLVNVDIGPLTGQTLPMISHGRTSFLLFSMTFGIILSFSREAKENSDREDAGNRMDSSSEYTVTIS